MTNREGRHPDSAEKTVRDIRRATRRKFSAEEKIRIVLEGLRGEETIAELCRKEGIAQNLYYRWSKDFLEAGKKRLAGDVAREATSDEVKDLRAEARQLKEALAEVTLENRLLKKTYGPPRLQEDFLALKAVCKNVSGMSAILPPPRWRSARFSPHKRVDFNRATFFDQVSETPIDRQAISNLPQITLDHPVGLLASVIDCSVCDKSAQLIVRASPKYRPSDAS